MNRQDLGISLIVVLIWGLNFIAIKLGLSNIPPFLLATIRFMLVCIPAILFVPKPPIAWRWLLALGLTLNVGQIALLFMGIKQGMPAGLASLVAQAQVFFTLFIAFWMLGEKWRRHHILGLLVAFAGIVIVGVQQGGQMTAVGFWLTLASAACWGTGNVVMRRATHGVPPFSMLSLVVWAGAVAVLPLGALSLIFEGPAAWKTAAASVDGVAVVSILYLGYCVSLIGYALWGRLLSRYPAAMVAPFSLLVPLVGLSSACLFLKETLRFFQIIGALLVMTGLFISVYGLGLKAETAKSQE